MGVFVVLCRSVVSDPCSPVAAACQARKEKARTLMLTLPAQCPKESDSDSLASERLSPFT